jgi:hypothetical protein
MFNIELVPCRLTPFDWSPIGTNTLGTINPGTPLAPVDSTLTTTDLANIQATQAASGFPVGSSVSGQFGINTGLGSTGLLQTGAAIYAPGHPLYPLFQTQGLVFPYNPIISEMLGVRYDTTELTHSNESIHAFKNTENVRLSLSDCVWSAETFDQAIYVLAVIHFFRSYVLMDFGRGTQAPSRKTGTGKPPSPMWFNAYGDYMYSQIPVLIERVDWTFPQDVDYVGVPNPGTDAYNNAQLSFAASADQANAQGEGYTWIPIKFTIGSITMVVQHSVRYWTQQFNLDDFKAGKLIGVMG